MMNITSVNFGLFVLFILIVYYRLPHRGQNYWLLVASYIFYLAWSWQFALTLALLTLVNFTLALELDRRSQNKAIWLWIGIAINFLTLVFFRTANFYLPGMMNLLSELGVNTGSASLQIFVPIGLSFYTLRNISYLIDVHRGQIKATREITLYALYLAYFPKLLSGPIERAQAFLPKLANRRFLDNNLLARSFYLIIIGIFRKLVISDYLASIIFLDAFETPNLYTAPELAGWLLMYALILYNDFAGYTSIVRGVSGLFAIELSPNFEQPFLARTFSEFWNRWHKTLSYWLRDYIYFPISRVLLRRFPSRWNIFNLVIPPTITMVVSGLWHGFNGHMVLWGGLHGVYLVIERIPSLWGPVVPIEEWPTWRRYAGTGLVFLLVLLAWIPFRMDLSVALGFLSGLLDWTNTSIRYRRLLVLIPVFVLVICLDWFQSRQKEEAFLWRWPRFSQALFLAVSIFMILMFTQTDWAEPFVYQGF